MLILLHWSVDYKVERYQKYIYSEFLEILVPGRTLLTVTDACKPATLLKITLLHVYFSCFFKLYT